ncbi:MAG TPA: glutathione transferase GstA [Rhizomicrobium sp.]|jgi:glutathione S-transferase
MKLYYSPGACSLAAHIVADEADLRLQLEKVDLKSHTTENGQNYYEVNPKGYVPAIQLDDGNVLTENMAVLNYLADHSGQRLHTPPPHSIARYRLEEWLAFINSELHKSFAPIFRGGSDAEKANAKKHILERFGYVDSQLAGKHFLMGDRITVADAYLFVMLAWAMKQNIELKPNLASFFARMAQRDSVQRAMKEEGLPLAA